MSRIRTNLITNRMANGAPTVSNGLVISGVTTSTNVSVASSVTATTFYGSGANLTGITQTAINTNADNRIITGSGTANTLNGESNLTFDGSTLGLTGSQTISGDLSIAQNLVHTGDTDTNISFPQDDIIEFDTAGTKRLQITNTGQIRIDQGTSANNGIRMRPSGWNYDFRFGAVSSSGGSIWLGQNYEPTGGTRDSSGYGTNYIRFTTSGEIMFGTGTTDTNPTERLKITNAGKVGINETSPDTKLHITHSNATEDVIKLEANPVSAGTGERSRMIFQVTQSNGQSAKLGHIASHSLNNWGGELAFHTKPANGSPNNTTSEVMRMHANGQVTQPAQPSFAAYRNQDGYSLNNAVFPFNVTRHNTGSHFNTGNHRFTAPVSGRYLFTFYSILNTQINSGVYSFRVNNSTSYGHNVHFTTVNSNWDHVSTSQIMNLNANDYVTLWSNSNINWHGNGWQIFCGELLS